jgi:hypothetical protein
MTPRRNRFSLRRLFHRRSGRSVTSCAPRADRLGPDHGDSAATEHTGTVAEVITELLALPPHGFSGAPTLARHGSSGLRLLGNF